MSGPRALGAAAFRLEDAVRYVAMTGEEAMPLHFANLPHDFSFRRRTLELSAADAPMFKRRP